ncbi:MAG: universal stress protein [Candidatus Korobacteraceae bacterium]|jgi:nucleotide-binding universal stress UspA family protein
MATAQLTAVRVGIQNVLIATDFSRCSNAALNFGLHLAKAYRAQAHVVFVIPTDQFLLAGPDAYVAAKDAAHRDLEQLDAELRRTDSPAQGENYHLYLLEGDVAQAILDFVHQKHIDLIVVGTHGRGGLGKALIGSVAERVFRKSPVPVLTLGPHLRRSTRDHAPRTIVVAADFTPASARAARYAAMLARENKSRLTLLHVVDGKKLEHLPDQAAIKRGIELRLADLLGSEAEAVDYSVQIEVGPVVPAILHALNEVDADLLVIGVRRSSSVLDRLMFPHAYELICESPCPVLTLRESDAPASTS